MPNVLALLSPVKDLLVPGGRRAVRVLRGPAKGVRLWMDLEDDAWIALGFYEPEVKGVIERHLEALAEGATCWDIGCSDGYYALAMAAHGQDVLAVEADEDRVSSLEDNLILNAELDERVRIHQGRVASLDDLPPPAPSLVKMDIEGAEGDVLEASPQTIESCSGWVVEVHGDELRRRCERALSKGGHEVRFVEQDTRWVRSKKGRNMERGWVVTDP